MSEIVVEIEDFRADEATAAIIALLNEKFPDKHLVFGVIPVHEFLDRGPVISSPLFPPENMVESAPLAKLRRLRPRMFELLEEMARVQTRKAKEYATTNDSYSNYREAGAAVGIPGSRYVESRFAEKQARHRELLNNGEMENTDGGYLESAIDRANTALIALHMHEQENE